jgi:hypothetical protein
MGHVLDYYALNNESLGSRECTPSIAFEQLPREPDPWLVRRRTVSRLSELLGFDRHVILPEEMGCYAQGARLPIPLVPLSDGRDQALHRQT